MFEVYVAFISHLTIAFASSSRALFSGVVILDQVRRKFETTRWFLLSEGREPSLNFT